MDTVVRPPEAPPEDPSSSAARPRRWPRRLALSVVIALIVLAIAAQVYLSSYQPLQTGTGSYSVRPFALVTRQFQAYGTEGSFTQSFVRITPESATWAKGTSVGLNTIALSYQTLWTHHTATIPIGQSIQICRGGCSD